MVGLLLHDGAGPALVVDTQMRVVRGNAALSELIQGRALLAQGAPVAPVFHESERDAAGKAMRQVLSGRGAAVCLTSALAGADDGKGVRLTIMALQEGRLGCSGALLRFADTTAQRALEAQLAHSQKLQATGQLAGGIAHDFNNLLTAILGAADGIIAREPPGETEEDARQVRASAQRGAALVRQLLAFGRQQTLQPRSLSVNDVITDISGLLRRLLGGQVRLQLELEQPGRMVRADPTQLDQVLVNLAVNARDAMPQGGDLTLRSGHISVFRPMTLGAETVPPGRYVMIEVQDTGCGIAPDVLPWIFDPFFTTRRERGGSGLGLSTVHGIIRQSDGFLAVDTEVGRGTSVRIYLPRWDGAAAACMPKPEPAPPRRVAPVSAPAGSRGVVLLVDDEDAVRHLAARALSRAGWEVLAAECGDSALALLQQRDTTAPPLAAIVSDMMMPGMDGAALLQAVRLVCGRADLPAILVSGYAESELRGGLAALGAVFMAKPYSLAQLVARLGEVAQVSADV